VLMPFFDTKDVGPVVLEIPPADESGSITGSVMDCWQAALEDVGPAGVDKGRGGKCLILPPNYKEKIPDGYIAMPSDNFQGYALLRSILQTGGDIGVAKAVAYAKRMKLYPLSQAASPSATTFVDASDVVFEVNIPYDSRFFDSLNRMVQSEPWLTRDKVMIDLLKTIGLEKLFRFVAHFTKIKEGPAIHLDQSPCLQSCMPCENYSPAGMSPVSSSCRTSKRRNDRSPQGLDGVSLEYPSGEVTF
jgi:hypothetical protein